MKTIISILVKIKIVLACTTVLAFAENIDKSLYREPNADNLVYLQIDTDTDTDTDIVIIELNPFFAPKHVKHVKHVKQVKQVKKLVRNKFYNGLTFSRVIDGFVAQAGTSINEDNGKENFKIQDSSLQLPLEASLSNIDNKKFTLVQSPDLFAEKTGFIDGFGVAKVNDSVQTWLTHCPSVVGMSRNNNPNMATTDFYIVIGQAPRYLDSTTTLFGRVIWGMGYGVWGMEVVQKINRGDANNNGIFNAPNKATTIKSMVMASDLPKNK